MKGIDTGKISWHWKITSPPDTSEPAFELQDSFSLSKAIWTQKYHVAKNFAWSFLAPLKTQSKISVFSGLGWAVTVRACQGRLLPAFQAFSNCLNLCFSHAREVFYMLLWVIFPEARPWYMSSDAEKARRTSSPLGNASKSQKGTGVLKFK